MTLIRSLSVVRVALVPLALAKILLDRNDFPVGYGTAAWSVLGVQSVIAVALLLLAYRWRGRLRRLGVLSVLADAGLAVGLIVAFSWEPGQPLRALVFLVVLEAAVLFRLRGGVIAGVLTLPVLVGVELVRDAEFGVSAGWDALFLRVLVALALGVVVGRLVDMERGQARQAEERAAEAERLRDELGRRIDVLEATSRAARALGSSLDLDAAFEAFVQELRALLPFDRAAVLLVESGGARVMATAGVGADTFLGPGSSIGVPGSILDDVIGGGRTIYREDIAEQRYPEEAGLLALGIRSRVLAPLQLGTRSIGALSVSRSEPLAFRKEEVDLITLLGRLVATAVQNLRTYEAERETVDELAAMVDNASGAAGFGSRASVSAAARAMPKPTITRTRMNTGQHRSRECFSTLAAHSPRS